MGKKRSVSSGRWLHEHFKDDYVQRAQAEGYRSRAVYKLAEMHRKHALFKPGMVVVDLGAAPGAWAQFAAERVGVRGRVLALDRLPIAALAGVDCYRGDINDSASADWLREMLNGDTASLVLSDMAPNISGNKQVDQPRCMQLADMALATAQAVLGKGGDVLIKVFQGEGIDQWRRALSANFSKVYAIKPKASRPRSPELYYLARTYLKP